jgi:hypothetical protein
MLLSRKEMEILGTDYPWARIYGMTKNEAKKKIREIGINKKRGNKEIKPVLEFKSRRL